MTNKIDEKKVGIPTKEVATAQKTEQDNADSTSFVYTRHPVSSMTQYTDLLPAVSPPVDDRWPLLSAGGFVQHLSRFPALQSVGLMARLWVIVTD